MASLLPSRIFGRRLDEIPSALAASATAATEALTTSLARTFTETIPESLNLEEETTVLRTVGWISAGLGAVALGLFVGRELRQRYKFNRRTPYDFYSHSGDEVQEFGVGV